MRATKWTTTYDDTDFREMREVAPRVFQFIDVMDMNEACGRDNEGQSKYVVELKLVDLNHISPETIQSAIESCGWEGAGGQPNAIAEMCHQHGAYAPLGSWSSNNRRKAHRDARSEAHSLLDADELAERMERPVNAIGSTASEFMTGDIMSAVTRGVTEGRHNARIMAKMYGAEQLIIDQMSDQRPADWLPWFAGYMDGKSGSEPETHKDLSPEYVPGYRRGELVRKGEAVAPGWIKQQKGVSQ